MKIQDAQLRVIKDSRGADTVEARILSGGVWFHASVPAGKSTGVHEAAVIAPSAACAAWEETRMALTKRSCATQQEFDGFLRALDGTPKKSRIGANVILALSISWARAYAHEQHTEFALHVRNLVGGGALHTPFPLFNMINGGAHAPFHDAWRKKFPHGRGLDMQEFQVIPTTPDFKIGLGIGQEFYRKLKEAVESEYGKEYVVLGDEAGFSAPFSGNSEALDMLQFIIEKHRYPLRIGLDSAASQFFSGEAYLYEGHAHTAQEMLGIYKKIIERYNVISLEDPFDEEDFDAFAALTSTYRVHFSEAHHSYPLIITDDLTTTNLDRLSHAVAQKAGNAILIKPNQIGTLSETIDAIRYARTHGWKYIISHRSGETMDAYIADIALGTGAWGLKAGAPGKPERMVKYNRILALEHLL